MVDNQPFVLGVDLDGVCADYEGAFRRCVAETLGVAEADLGPQTAWEFAACGWGIRDDAHFRELHQRAVLDQRMFSWMPEVPGASDTLWRLSDAGIHVRIITHRLCVNWGHDVAVADTVSWLQASRPDGRPRIPYRDLCFISNKVEVGCDLLVDDAPHNVLAARRSRIDAVVFDTGYNRAVPGARAHGWADVERFVLQRVAERQLFDLDGGPGGGPNRPAADAA